MLAAKIINSVPSASPAFARAKGIDRMPPPTIVAIKLNVAATLLDLRRWLPADGTNSSNDGTGVLSILKDPGFSVNARNVESNAAWYQLLSGASPPSGPIAIAAELFLLQELPMQASRKEGILRRQGGTQPSRRCFMRNFL